MGANAVELTVEQAWLVADVIGAGNFPWVLAITPPYSDRSQRADFEAARLAELTEFGVMRADRTVDPAVAQWVRSTCYPDQWLDLRFVSGSSDLLRGIVARRSGQTVVALRNAELITFTEMELDHPHALVPVLVAGLAQRDPARFDEFAMPAAVGARADEKLRNGAPLDDVLDFLGIPPSARPVVQAAFDARRSYVEIVGGEHRDGQRVSTEVGVSVVDTPVGRILVSPAKAFDGQWVSTFSPGSVLAIASAVERLTATLPSGAWFPDQPLTRDFDTEQYDQRTEKHCPTPR